ncbi:alpha/beta hydrolase family protein [Mesorhizobium kowhaii]|uniref:alpha/beta hydrolase family protein n=1 Tax=Mesorhizobium kowhaii TaxID=1300272 RepID=UPI0035E905AA
MPTDLGESTDEDGAHFKSPLGADVDDIDLRIQAFETALVEQKHQNELIIKRIDDLLWMQALEDVSTVSKIKYTGPARFEENDTAQAAGTELTVYGYVFIQKHIDKKVKPPLLVFMHGGVHSNLKGTEYMAVVRELMDPRYVIVAPDYRGGTGYGSDYYNQLDYGGADIDDVYRSGELVLDRYDFIDSSRVGILGWSQGGGLTLWNISNYPDAYQAAYAGVPVSNLALRAGTKAQGSRGYLADDYGAPSGIGKPAYDNVKEYVKRSPVYNAENLCGPQPAFLALLSGPPI